MFSFFRGRERQRERETVVRERVKDIKNETSVGERKTGRETGVGEREIGIGERDRDGRDRERNRCGRKRQRESQREKDKKR